MYYMKTRLFVDGVSFTKHDIAPEEAGHEGICATFFTAIHFLLQKHGRLVYRDKLCQVCCVLFRGSKDRTKPSWPAGSAMREVYDNGMYHSYSLSTPEKYSHDQGMWKAHFNAINKTIACAFQDS